jgi:hypothetical protein
LEKATVGIAVALALVAAISLVGVFYPSQQQVTIENQSLVKRSWHLNLEKSLFGTGFLNTSLKIDSEIWMAYWSVETRSENGEFYMWIYGSENQLVIRDAWYNKVSGLGAGSGTATVIGSGTFRVSISPTEIDNWVIWIYEYY